MKVPLPSYAGFFALLVFVGSATQPGLASRVPGPAVARLAQAPPATDPNQVVRRTCTTCHNDQSLRGNLSLEHFDVTADFTTDAADADVAERMVRKLRAGMMPPPGARRPDADTLLTLVETLERNLDAGAAAAPDPGGVLQDTDQTGAADRRRPVHRRIGVL